MHRATHAVGTADAADLEEPGVGDGCGSVGEVDVDLDAVAGRRSAHDGADALRRAATAADDPTEVARADARLRA